MLSIPSTEITSTVISLGAGERLEVRTACMLPPQRAPLRGSLALVQAQVGSGTAGAGSCRSPKLQKPSLVRSGVWSLVKVMPHIHNLDDGLFHRNPRSAQGHRATGPGYASGLGDLWRSLKSEAQISTRRDASSRQPRAEGDSNPEGQLMLLSASEDPRILLDPCCTTCARTT